VGTPVPGHLPRRGEPMSRPGPGSPESLSSWLAWNRTPDCACPQAWRSLGRLHGVSMGSGWVRLSTAAGCPHHADAACDAVVEWADGGEA